MANARTVYTFKGEVEYRTAKDSGWLLNRASGKLTPFDGIRLYFRAVGERRWRTRVLVPDESLGGFGEIRRSSSP